MPIVAIESCLDGAGKTTTAMAVAERIGGLFVPTLSGEVWRAQRSRVNQGHDVEARFQYFRDLNCEQLNIVRTMVATNMGRIALLDSSIFRTVATHSVLGSEEAAEYTFGPGMCPDATILLQLDEAIRLQRIQARDGGLVHPSHWDEQLLAQRSELEAVYAGFNLPTVDAGQGVDGVVNQVVERMGQLGLVEV